MNSRTRCGICNKYVSIVIIGAPRVKGEINYVCKEHGVVNSCIVSENKKEG
jgi:hypothetical protein